ncbi:endonuclease domain-containing 1 protein-like [Ambystoma mexicanum]|uniref:endonuclease domain-containing 1 protein-like n=1 Tax=Ambystoma mexicanum TaxID=8296 RepID=UPI0037E9B937
MFHFVLLAMALNYHTVGNAEVITSPFSDKHCPGFFYKDTEPKNLMPQSFARICQRFNNKYRFATMYDRQNHIPVYSAYVYQAGNSNRIGWLIEPQLVGNSYNKEMEDEVLTTIDRNLLRASQALDDDYKDTKYDRGHINPSLHHNDPDDSMSTFTLTNIVPQNATLNQGAWRHYEEDTIKHQAADCTRTYAIVGAIPGNNYISKGRVNVPAYIWAAACCTLQNGGMKAWAVIADNSGINRVDPITLADLEKKLSTHPTRPVHLFHTDCPKNTLIKFST